MSLVVTVVNLINLVVLEVIYNYDHLIITSVELRC